MTSFGVYNDTLWNRDGTFKKFVKRLMVTADHKIIRGFYDSETLDSLRIAFKGNYTVKAYKQCESKGRGWRYATDWTYTVNA